MRRDAETLSTKRFKLVNIRGEEARARRSILESQLRDLKAREKEDREWAEAGDGEKSSAASKREEQAKNKAEAAAGKSLAMKKVEQEVRDVEEGHKKKAEKAWKWEISEAERQISMRMERAAIGAPAVAAERKSDAEKWKWGRIVSQSDYKRMVMAANTNRCRDCPPRGFSELEAAVFEMTERAHFILWPKSDPLFEHYRDVYIRKKDRHYYCSDDFQEYEDDPGDDAYAHED